MEHPNPSPNPPAPDAGEPPCVGRVRAALEALDADGRKWLRRRWYSLVHPYVFEPGVSCYFGCDECHGLFDDFKRLHRAEANRGRLSDACSDCATFCPACKTWYTQEGLEYSHGCGCDGAATDDDAGSEASTKRARLSESPHSSPPPA